MKNPLRPAKFEPLVIDSDMPPSLLKSASELLADENGNGEAKLRFRNDAIRAELVEFANSQRAEVHTFKSEDGTRVTHVLGNGVTVTLRAK